MKKLPIEVLDNYNKFELKKLKKYIKDYIVPLDINKIKYQILTNEELTEFYEENYYINFKFVEWYNNGYYNPLGMHFLSINLPRDMKVFMLTIPNKINRETIIGSIIYSDNFKTSLEEQIFLIDTIEINYFYRNKGLLDIMYNEFIKSNNINKDIILTCLSQMGHTCHVDKHLSKMLKKNNIDKNVILYDEYKYIK